VTSDQNQRGSQHPEHNACCSSKEEEGDGAEPNTSVLLSQTNLMTSHCDLPLSILQTGNVASSPSGSHHYEQEGGGDETVEDEDEEDQDVVGLEILNILVQSLRQSPSRGRNLEVARVEEHSNWSDARSSPSKPFLDGRLRNVDWHRETHSSKYFSTCLLITACLVVRVNISTQANLGVLI